LLQTVTRRNSERQKKIVSGLEDGYCIPTKKIDFLFSTTLRPNLEPNTKAFRRPFSGNKRSERGANFSFYPVPELGLQGYSTSLFNKPQNHFYTFGQILSFIFNTPET